MSNLEAGFPIWEVALIIWILDLAVFRHQNYKHYLVPKTWKYPWLDTKSMGMFKFSEKLWQSSLITLPSQKVGHIDPA